MRPARRPSARREGRSGASRRRGRAARVSFAAARASLIGVTPRRSSDGRCRCDDGVGPWRRLADGRRRGDAGARGSRRSRIPTSRAGRPRRRGRGSSPDAHAAVSMPVAVPTTTRVAPLPSSTSNASPEVSAVGLPTTSRRCGPAGPRGTRRALRWWPRSAPARLRYRGSRPQPASARSVRWEKRSSISPVTRTSSPGVNVPSARRTAMPPVASATKPPPSWKSEPVSVTRLDRHRPCRRARREPPRSGSAGGGAESAVGTGVGSASARA